MKLNVGPVTLMLCVEDELIKDEIMYTLSHMERKYKDERDRSCYFKLILNLSCKHVQKNHH